uniref:Uncharacterized protein n=1 Tax=Arundo donax TaxID=35708 RepID=A0A0A9G529_ARUDO
MQVLVVKIGCKGQGGHRM